MDHLITDELIERMSQADDDELKEYSMGVLCGAKSMRNRKDILPGMENPSYELSHHFWRGVVDAGGSVRFIQNKGYDYPLFRLEGSFRFLEKFLDYLEVACPQVLADGKMRESISAWRVDATGTKAKAIVEALYLGAGIANLDHQDVADRVVTWESKRGGNK